MVDLREFTLAKLTGGASFYDLPGNPMANGEPFDGSAMTAAMLKVAFGKKVKVSLVSDQTKSITVTVTDRGPYFSGRTIDLIKTAFKKLTGSLSKGVVQVVVDVP